MAMERTQYSRIESVHDSSATATSSPTAPRTLRHKMSRAFSTLTRRDPAVSPSSPSRERGPAPPPTSPAAERGTGKREGGTRERQSALKRTWGLARARSEPALRATRAKAAAAAMLAPPPPVPAVPSKSAPAKTTTTKTTHSRDVNAYTYAQGQGRESGGAVAAYSYPLWRIDPVLVGCFVCL